MADQMWTEPTLKEFLRSTIEKATSGLLGESKPTPASVAKALTDAIEASEEATGPLYLPHVSVDDDQNLVNFAVKLNPEHALYELVRPKFSITINVAGTK